MRRVFILLFLSLILLPPVSAQLLSKKSQVRLFPFVADGKWGFIDKAGNIVIEPSYRSVSGFSDGFAAVEFENGRMTFINPRGERQFEPTEMRIFPLSEGMARAFKKGKFGYVTSKGKVEIPFRFDSASNFFNGIARIQIDRKFAFINKKGEFRTKFYKRAYNFSEGLAIVEIRGKRGYIDVFDDLAIKPIFDDSDGFSQGLAAVRVGSKYGYIDRSGIFAVQAKFDNARWFSDGLAPVELAGRWGFINQAGELKIEPSFTEVGNFYEGMAAVKVGEKWGYINKLGLLVIPPKFTRTGRFSLGLASVEDCPAVVKGEAHKPCRLAYVTRLGEIIWNSKP